MFWTFLLSYNGRVKTVVSIHLNYFWRGVLLVRPSQTTSAAGRLFLSAGSPKTVGWTARRLAFFFLSFLLCLSPLTDWFTVKRRIRQSISMREWFKGGGQLFVSFYDSAPVGPMSESCFTTTLADPRTLWWLFNWCHNSSLCPSYFFFPLLIYRAKFKWITAGFIEFRQFLSPRSSVQSAVKAFAFRNSDCKKWEQECKLCIEKW